MTEGFAQSRSIMFGRKHSLMSAIKIIPDNTTTTATKIPIVEHVTERERRCRRMLSIGNYHYEHCETGGQGAESDLRIRQGVDNDIRSRP